MKKIKAEQILQTASKTDLFLFFLFILHKAL